MNRISFYHLPTDYVSSTYHTGSWIDGPFMKKLEKRLQDYLGVAHVVLTNSGTSSLLAMYWVLRSEFQELHTDPYTFPATYQPARMLGYKVHFRRSILAELLSYSKTGLNTVVHLFGQPMGLPVPEDVTFIEDVAQAFGGERQGRKLGSFGLMSAFSFYPTKILHACGHGGAIATNDPKLYEALKLIVECGRRGGKMTEAIGLNLRLDEVKAEFLLAELDRFEERLDRQRGIAKRLMRLLPGPQPLLEERPGDRHVYSVFNMVIDNRDEFRSFMNDAGIDTLIYYGEDMLPEAEREYYRDLTSRIAAVPCRWNLTDEEVDRIEDALGKWFAEAHEERIAV